MSGNEPAEDTEPTDAAPARPLLRVVRGEPSAEEVAALSVVVAAAASGGRPAADPGPRSVWAERVRLTRRPLRPGPGAWRASALPR